MTAENPWGWNVSLLLPLATWLLNPLAPVDTFMCHNNFTLKRHMTHLGDIMEHVKFKLPFWHYKVGTGTSILLAMWELSLSIPTRSFHPHGESLSGTILALSSLTKSIALHIAHVGVYIAARVNSNKQSYRVTAVGLTLALYPTSVNFTPIFLNRTGCLHLE